MVAGTIKDMLKSKIPKSKVDLVPSSYDIVGTIVVIEIPDELQKYEKKIAAAIMKIHKNVLTIAKKGSEVRDEYRVRKLKIIGGEKTTETVYKEHGCLIKLDLAKVYFSSRLSNERNRIAEQVKPGEKIAVFFAGVGPFALVIAKKHPDAKIVAVEINPVAVRYMRENIILNKIKNIEILEGDVRDSEFANFSFDRVIMPLPKSAHEFLDVAFAAVKAGGIVHFYTLANRGSPFDEAIALAKKEAADSIVSIKVLSKRIVRPYSPSTVQVVLDLRVRKPS